MVGQYTAGPLNPAPEFPGVSFKIFCNPYSAEFQDTNNISLVTILRCKNTKFVIPGDVEGKGWKALLKQPAFVSEIADSNVFIASHYGRESGYLCDVLTLAKPQVVVFSDSAISCATQAMSSTYGNHCSGTTLNGAPRKCLSTRSDGSLVWNL